MPIVDMSEENKLAEDSLESWVMEKVDQWRDDYDSNYRDKHDEYYRLFRGIWDSNDRTRASERSRLISPAIQQAVESCVAEIEEATFGRGKWFDIQDDKQDSENADVVKLREMMHEDFGKLKTRAAIAEVILNAAIFGEGVGELVLEEITERRPDSEVSEDGSQIIGGVREFERTVTKLVPVMPKHFLIDPAACSIDEALGVVVDKEVPSHTIEMLQQRGVYLDKHIHSNITDQRTQTDIELARPPEGQTRLTKYFGLVPRDLLDKAKLAPNQEIVDLELEDDDTDYVEAIVILADGGTLLKAEANPNMMGDRNVVAFQWDKLPSRFRGRGVVEKGYNSQKALDAEMRARADALALTTHPMMGMDASRMPKGARPTVAPGKVVLTNGAPQEVLFPFKFGGVDQVTFAQAGTLQSMVMQATGADDTTSGSLNGDQAAAAMSMTKGSLLKRHKRTQLNFEENFLIPFITKVGWRYMQYDPENFPSKDYKFIVRGSLGIIAREYEVTQLVQLLQTVGDDSPVKIALMEGVVDHMNVSNREEIIELMRQAAQPSEQEQQAAEEARQAQLRFQESQSAALEGQAAESMARAKKYDVESRAVPVELENKRLDILASMDSEDDKKFKRRIEVTDRMLKERDLNARIFKTPSN